MQPYISYTLCNNRLVLATLKCIFWEEEQALIISDLHLGKTSHFRKHGIAMPMDIFNADVQNVEIAVRQFNPAKIIVVGDMFHSSYNNEVELFGRWMQDFNHLEWILVKGNHDILNNEVYAQLGLKVLDELLIDKFLFVHDLPEQLNPEFFYFTGHVHPAVLVQIGKTQARRFPCFYFNQQYCILPSFSIFTGLHTIKQKKQDAVFAIVNNSIMEV